jgi:hypothetical protein
VEAVGVELQSGRSVLLVGPEAIGKSAIAQAFATPEVILLDPFEHVGRLAAKRLRQRLDRGHVAVATARSHLVRDIGAVGRILWQFRTLRVRPLQAGSIHQILIDTLHQEGASPLYLPDSWWAEAIAAAGGRPGYAVAIGRDTARALAESGRWPSPGLVVIDYRIAHARTR